MIGEVDKICDRINSGADSLLKICPDVFLPPPRNLHLILGIRLMIATPFYEGKAFVNYLVSLIDTIMALNGLYVPFITHFPSGDAYVDRAKNSILATFLESDCTHLMMIDSDLGWNIEGFLRVLMAPYDFVGGSYPMKQVGKFPVRFMYNDNREIDKQADGVIQAEWIPGGFVKYSRKCIERMRDEYKWNVYTDEMSSYTKETANLFECKVESRLRCGEDYVFAKKWRAIGGKIYCEPRIAFSHQGTYSWCGCLSDVLQ